MPQMQDNPLIYPAAERLINSTTSLVNQKNFQGSSQNFEAHAELILKKGIPEKIADIGLLAKNSSNTIGVKNKDPNQISFAQDENGSKQCLTLELLIQV